MKLKAKNIDVSTGGAQIVILDYHDARGMNLYSGDRVKVKYGKKEISAIVEIANTDPKISDFRQVPKGKLGLFAESAESLGTKNNSILDISLENKPKSIEIIKKKLEGKKLNYSEIDTLVKEIVNKKLSNVELTYFVSGSYINGLDMTEAVHLTNAIVNNDAKITFPKGKVIMDKHCIGGVPGNRTTMVVVPIIASLGLYIPKTSSRSITSPAGTSDTVEVLANVSLDAKKIKKVVEKTNGCLVWGGGVNLASADDKLIKVRHPLSLDPRGMLLASIMAKKHSVSATHVLIDIPVGKGAKIEDMTVANELKKQFETISKRLGMKCKVAITDGSQPIGKGIGPALEAKDVLYTLMNDPRGSLDLKEKGITLATEMYLLSGKIKSKVKARKEIEELFNSGAVFKKFKEILRAQGAYNLDPEKIPMGSYKKNILAKKSGVIKSIDNKKISLVARLAGAPSDQLAGMILNCKVGQKINKGEVLFTLYSSSKVKGEYAYKAALNDSPFKI